MNPERLEYLTSIIGSLVLAHYYALFERWFDWAEVQHWFIRFARFPAIREVYPYHYLFMAGLFLFIGALPLLDNYILRINQHLKGSRAVAVTAGNCLLMAVVEDAAYFYLYKTWITPTDWTCQFGYITFINVIIPNWYFIFVVIIIILYVFGLKSEA